MKEVQDHYFRLAKERGYRARSAFKLLEIDERFRLLRPGLRVLDVGAAPGSWTQVSASAVGPRGRVIAIDVKEIDGRGLPSNVELVCEDLNEIDPARFASPPADLVLSDMAPDTTGVPSADSAVSVRLCNALLDRVDAWLRPGGSLVMKAFEGAEYPALLRRAQSLFESVKGFKPKSSRAESVEMFVVCQRRRSRAASPPPPRSTAS
ncbi:MAG: RlmE family RNA methyltransferase [Phycisphaerae bacterium]|nr:RlmE family RNA methyltransferase [Phycisphaerae bacterium]